jgi:hypothetical protein
MSWWFHEQGISPADFAAMEPEARMEWVLRYFEEEGRGWAPDVARADWVGPHHPSEPEPPPARRFPPPYYEVSANAE